MNNRDTLQENEIIECLEAIKVQPSNRFYQSMANKSWMSTRESHHVAPSTSWRDLLTNMRMSMVGIVMLLLVVGLVFLTPSLRILAQEILDLFVQGSTDTMATTELIHTSEPEYQLWQADKIQAIDKVAQTAGFTVVVPTVLPANYQFGHIAYLPNEQLVVSQYLYATSSYTDALASGAASIMLAQQPITQAGEVPLLFKIGASAEIEIVTLGDIRGEYVEGGWTSQSSRDPTVTWRWLSCCRMLRWQQDKFIFTLSVHNYANAPGFVGRNELIEIATNLSPSR